MLLSTIPGMQWQYGDRQNEITGYATLSLQAMPLHLCSVDGPTYQAEFLC